MQRARPGSAGGGWGGACHWESRCFWGREQHSAYIHLRAGSLPGTAWRSQTERRPLQPAACGAGGAPRPPSLAMGTGWDVCALLSVALLAAQAFPQTNIKISQGECKVLIAAWGKGNP